MRHKNDSAKLNPTEPNIQHDWAKITFVSLTYAAIVGAKDLVYRGLSINGLNSFQILAGSGLGCLAASLVFTIVNSGLKKSTFKLKSPRTQFIRFFLSGLTSLFIIRSFEHLHATTVATTSKIFIPLLILLSPIWGKRLDRTQIVLAVTTILTIFIFGFFERSSQDPIIGYIDLAAAIFLVMAEFVLLRKTALTEAPFWAASVPAMGCLAYGFTGSLYTTSALWHQQNFMVNFELLVGGLLLFAAYAVSKYRYTVLPVGYAEVPSILSAMLVLPAEVFLFGWRPEPMYIIFLLLILLQLVCSFTASLKSTKIGVPANEI